jgi:hypothetical protein
MTDSFPEWAVTPPGENEPVPRPNIGGADDTTRGPKGTGSESLMKEFMKLQARDPEDQEDAGAINTEIRKEELRKPGQSSKGLRKREVQ